METIYQIAVILIALYITVEVATAIYIYRNRQYLVPRIFAFIRAGLGIGDVNMRVAAHDAVVKENFARIERKINYLGNHVKFERDQLRKMGVLKDQPIATPGLRLSRINPSNRD